MCESFRRGNKVLFISSPDEKEGDVMGVEPFNIGTSEVVIIPSSIIPFPFT
jgi:hypothetical protein